MSRQPRIHYTEIDKALMWHQSLLERKFCHQSRNEIPAMAATTPAISP